MAPVQCNSPKRVDLSPATARYSLKINTRLCVQCGKSTRNPVYCNKCFVQTPGGKAERRMESIKAKYKPMDCGGPCAPCIHWSNQCYLGFPEAGSKYAADCPAMLTEVIE